MEVAVIGAGYVGLVTAAGLAALGHRVQVGEADEAKLARLERGEVPFYEAGLDRLVAKGIEDGLLTFHGDNHVAVAEAAVVIVALPTPPAADGSADLAVLDAAISDFSPSLRPRAVVALKSTVPVGSVARLQATLDEGGIEATVVSNPEFLREGTAVGDFFEPDRIVVGSRDDHAPGVLVELYKDIPAPVLITDPPSSEMIKYASNAYLATRITFANALANLCEGIGANVGDVLNGMGHDKRIGSHFLSPGPGYGGSCFPKDTKALVAIADQVGYDFSLLRGVIEVNELQHQRIVDKVSAGVGSLAGAKVGLWGLAFKAGTDDLRESPAVKIARSLSAAGAMVTAYDPAVVDLGEDDRIEVVDDPIRAVKDADLLLIATEWAEFRDVDLGAVRDAMAGNTIVDARNLLDPLAVRQLGMTYTGVGQ